MVVVYANDLRTPAHSTIPSVRGRGGGGAFRQFWTSQKDLSGCTRTTALSFTVLLPASQACPRSHALGTSTRSAPHGVHSCSKAVYTIYFTAACLHSLVPSPGQT